MLEITQKNIFVKIYGYNGIDYIRDSLSSFNINNVIYTDISYITLDNVGGINNCTIHTYFHNLSYHTVSYCSIEREMTNTVMIYRIAAQNIPLCIICL